MSTAATLQTIAKALPSLHDDAYNPVRAASVEPIEVNVWTIEALADNERATTHPHLRRAQGARSIPVPSGDRDAARLYRDCAKDIADAHQQLLPGRRTRGYDGPPPPVDLVGMLAAIHQHLDRTGRPPPSKLVQLAAKVEPWTRTWTPKAGYATCANPDQRRRCQGHPIHANDLCKSCYNHARYKQRSEQEREAS